MLPDYINGNLIHGLFNENATEYVDANLLTERQTRIVAEMRPSVAKDLPGNNLATYFRSLRLGRLSW